MIFIVKPFLKRIGDLYGSKEYRKAGFGYFLSFLILSSYATEVIGFMPFWSFMMGSIMPDISKFRMIFIEKVEDVAVILLLPLFLYLGLKTEIGLINDPYLWKVRAIIMVAVVGKFLGSALQICWTELEEQSQLVP
jgi:Kef-type K+ transport system membrane component KefB